MKTFTYKNYAWNHQFASNAWDKLLDSRETIDTFTLKTRLLNNIGAQLIWIYVRIVICSLLFISPWGFYNTLISNEQLHVYKLWRY